MSLLVVLGVESKHGPVEGPIVTVPGDQTHVLLHTVPLTYINQTQLYYPKHIVAIKIQHIFCYELVMNLQQINKKKTNQKYIKNDIINSKKKKNNGILCIHIFGPKNGVPYMNRYVIKKIHVRMFNTDQCMKCSW